MEANLEFIYRVFLSLLAHFQRTNAKILQKITKERTENNLLY